MLNAYWSVTASLYERNGFSLPEKRLLAARETASRSFSVNPEGKKRDVVICDA